MCFVVLGDFCVILVLVLLFNKNPGIESSLLLAKYLMGSEMSSEVLHCKIILQE